MNSNLKGKPAVIYNQDALSDYVKSGGSVESLFEEDLRGGNRIIVLQEPANAPAAVLMVLETQDDVKRWKKSRIEMQEWLNTILRPPETT